LTSIPFDIVGFDLDGTLFDTSGDLAPLNGLYLLVENYVVCCHI